MQGKDLFNKHAAEWLAILDQPPNSHPFDVAISRGKTQILADVKSGIIPRSVGSFSDLHDHVDANYYGNAFDWPVLPSETNDDAYQQASDDFWNAVQDNLSGWISSGEMRNALSQRGRA